MNTTKPMDKPFAIPKLLVWEAWRQVKANKGAPGVDEQEIEQFEADLQGNLYRVWNRMSSGTWFPPPVLAVEIPKPHGTGVRVLGVPTVADRVAQTVVAKFLEPLVRFVATSAEKRWPPVGKFVAASGENSMAIDSGPGGPCRT